MRMCTLIVEYPIEITYTCSGEQPIILCHFECPPSSDRRVLCLVWVDSILLGLVSEEPIERFDTNAQSK